MHYLSTDEIKSEELRMLVSFDGFCKKHGLQYSLAGGTLLGAVRHQGFIPWDDDIDVCMGRSYYDAMLSVRSLFESETGYRIMPYRGTTIDATPYIKVVNEDVLVKADVESSVQGLWIDVFPVDGLPVDTSALESLYSKANFFRKTLIVAGVDPRSGSTKAKRIAKAIVCTVLRPSFTEKIGAKLDALGRAIPYGSTPYVGGLTWGLYGVGERVSYDSFERQVSLSFEGLTFSCMSCWHEYLSGLYGNYMELPPVNKRVSHGVKAWRRGSGDM